MIDSFFVNEALPMIIGGLDLEVNMTTTKTEHSPSVLDRHALHKIAEFMRAIESLEHTLNGDGRDGQVVLLQGPITVQGEGFVFGTLESVDDFWVFTPDIK